LTARVRGFGSAQVTFRLVEPQGGDQDRQRWDIRLVCQSRVPEPLIKLNRAARSCRPARSTAGPCSRPARRSLRPRPSRRRLRVLGSPRSIRPLLGLPPSPAACSSARRVGSRSSCAARSRACASRRSCSSRAARILPIPITFPTSSALVDHGRAGWGECYVRFACMARRSDRQAPEHRARQVAQHAHDAA